MPVYPGAPPVPTTACSTFHAPYTGEFFGTRSKIGGAFHGLRPIPTGSALPLSCVHRPPHGAASFPGCCGPPNCTTPLRTRHFGRARELHYRGPWRLPGPDSHRLVVASLSLGYVMNAPLQSWRPRAAGRTGFSWDGSHLKRNRAVRSLQTAILSPQLLSRVDGQRGRSLVAYGIHGLRPPVSGLIPNGWS